MRMKCHGVQKLKYIITIQDYEVVTRGHNHNCLKFKVLDSPVNLNVTLNALG